jgi:NFU1 iron-sulfur cluster scaffold homolog, mitochondrial
MIPIHAIATANPQQLRWVITPDRLPPRGTVRQAPGRLGGLLDDGVIDEIVVGAASGTADVLVTLGAGHRWRELGDDIRDALCDALLDPAGWQVEAPPDDTATLAAIAAELLNGPIGALAASHGGSIELVSVVGDNVTVRMSGACHGCAAAGSTLHDKLQSELRRRAGQHVTVHSENDSSAMPSGRPLTRKLLSLIIR